MDQPVDDENAGGPQRERVSLDRLRERTDELELLISGLSMVALFALPGWLLERYYDNYTQLPISLLAAAISIVPMGIAFAYTLGSCFLLHLVVRACWVGLIGLHATFPHGVRWERLPGPIQRERLRARMAPLPRAIASADRLASTLYSLITLVALLLLWMGGVFTLALLVAFAIGQALNATNTVLSGTIDLLALTLIANGLLLWLLDGVLAQRFPGLARISIVQWLVAASATLNRAVLPDRLIGPVRLTLQSNTSPRLFNLMLLLLLISVPFLGMRYFRGQTTFDAFGTQRYVDAVDTRGGIRSQHYASLRTRQDRLRAWPVIPDRVISTVDPEARHAHKTVHRRQDGFKAHIAVEPDTGLVTACAVTMASGRGNSDAEVGPTLLAQETEKLHVLADSAYGSGSARAELDHAGHIALIKPFPLRSAVPGGFTLDDFTVDPEARTATCPNGVTRSITAQWSVTFGAACRGCPLRAQCTTSDAGRSLKLTEYESLLRAARRQAETEEFQQVYRRHRPMVERSISWLVRGNRKVRYRGVTKNDHWLHHRAAAINLHRLITLGLDRTGGNWVIA